MAMQSYWSSEFSKLEQLKCNSTVNKADNDGSSSTPYFEMKSNGFVNQDYVTNGSAIKPVSFIEPEFVSTHGNCDSRPSEPRPFEDTPNTDPLTLDDEEHKFPVVLEHELCETCGKLYSPNESYHCNGDEKMMFLEEQRVIADPILSTSPKKSCHRVEINSSETAHLTHSLCPYCNVVYEHDELADHISLHSNLPYICDRCGVFLSGEEELGEHEKQHGDTVLCMTCFKVCDDAVDLATHITVRALPLECQQCGEIFASYCAMHSHRATCTPKKKILNVNNQKVKCSQCPMVFATQQRLDDHFRQHTGERPFFCEYCLQTYSRKDNLNRHMRKNRIEDSFACKCNVCQLEFPSKCSLKKHYSTEHPEQSVEHYMRVARPMEPSEPIVINGRTLRARIQQNISESTLPQILKRPLRSRIQSSEQNIAPLSQISIAEETAIETPKEIQPVRISCDRCSKTFGYRKSLAKHLRTAHVDIKLPHACHLCIRSFSDVDLLNRHLNWHKGAQYQCRDCGICYSHSKHLQRHLKKMHSTRKNDCPNAQPTPDANLENASVPIISEIFSAAEEITATVDSIKSEMISPVEKTHINSNSIFNNVTDTCTSKKFLTYVELLKYVERTPKPYSCQVCGKMTDTKRNYLEHYMSHSKERPFKCDVCGQGFIRERRMLDHRVVHERAIKRPRIEESVENTYYYTSLTDNKTHLQTHIRTFSTDEKMYLMRPRPDDSTYLAKFSHLLFKTPSITLNRFDLYAATSEGLVQSSSSMVHFRCDHCGRAFSRRSALVAHQKACTCNSPMSTEIPRARRSKPFKYLQSYEREDKIVVYGMEHSICTVNGVQLYTCGVCGRTFDKKNFIFKHTLIHVRDKPFKCALCMHRGFMTRNSLKKHFRKCHKGLTIDKDGNVVNKDGSTATTSGIWSNLPFANNVQTSLLADRLTQGYADNTASKSPEQITVECDLFDMINIFDPEMTLEKERVEPVNQNIPINAPVVTFSQSYPVHTVFITQPIGVRQLATDVEMPFVDSYPNYNFNDVTMNHFLESNDVEMENAPPAAKSAGSFVSPEEVFLTCGQCNKSFETKEEMFKHYVAHDVANDPIKCAICDKEFVRRQYLQMHAMMHARPKRFHCTYCPKSFRAKRDMDDHVRTHTGEKPFACEYCGRKFRVRKQLYAHRKLHVQAFQCKKCSASFNIEWSLKRHEKLCLQEGQNVMSVIDSEIIVKEENDVIKQEVSDHPITPEAIVPEISVTEIVKSEALECPEDSPPN